MQAVHLPSFPADQFKGKSGAGPHGDFIYETDWIVGVRSSEKLSRVVSSVVGKVKLASKEALPLLVQTSGMAGLELEHMTRPPRELAPRVGWEYFLVKRSRSVWKGIRDSLEVGVWVPDEIVDADLELSIVLRAAD